MPAASAVTLAISRKVPGLRMSSAVSNGAPNPILEPSDSPNAASGVETSSTAIVLGKKISAKLRSDVKATVISWLTSVAETNTRSGNQKEWTFPGF